ncbi:hypothetical protein PAHAL_4G008000 [Panicum hallii]|uniref:DUF4220 domain-containing protein n=2 Tax=Panicum hallii TaxID=206008 RepID=A0A2T8JBC0_9POAL|nr:hypothetical protein PAHAL_4G008000 [Panicum hallii]
MRKYTIPRWFRTFIWLAYIGSDALAIYALATLFNRHASSSTSSCANGGWSRALEVLWAPVLLIHLGGQKEVSAYNIEDNELWTRHTVTLVSQVAFAVYAFCKSWPSSGDRRLLASAILLFVVGILSFSEKPWALRRASINRLAAESSSRMHGRERKPRRRWGLFTKLEDQVPSDSDLLHMILSGMSLFAVHTDLLMKRELMRQDSIRAAEMRWQREEGMTLQTEVEGEDEVLGPLSHSAGVKRWPAPRRAFGLIYTRVNVATTPAYLAFHFLLVPAIHVAAITLFAASRKRGYDPTDVKITYVILFVTAALDVLAETIRQLLYKLMSAAGVPALCETLPQYNVLTSARRRTQPATGWLLKCAARLGWEEHLLLVCRRDESHLFGRVAVSVITCLFQVQGLDLGSYRSFTAGNWALSVELQERCGPMVRRTLRKSFDESVLIWHIATDLCFRRNPPPAAADAAWECERTRAISNYMAHVLNFRPDMLMYCSRRHLLTEALEDLESILLRPDLDDTALLEAIQKAGESEQHKYPLIHDACKLSDELMEVWPEETRWELMYRAWLGMLCYSASMCRGYLHAKSLGEGGEFLSFVWLFLSLKGAKTLADKLQMPEPDAQDDIWRSTATAARDAENVDR